MVLFNATQLVRVGVRWGEGKIDVVIKCAELKFEGKAIFLMTNIDIILLIAVCVYDIFLTVGLYWLKLPFFGGRAIEAYAHTFVVHEGFLGEVDNFEEGLLFVFKIGDFEHKPGSIAFGVSVNPHEKIVSILSIFDGKVEITTLEVGVES